MSDLALEYVRQGHEVIVVTPSDSGDATTITEEDEVTVVRVKTGNLKFASKGLRMWREIRLSSTMWRRARKFLKENRCDLVIFYSPTIFFGDLVRRLKSMWACHSYLILRDIFPKWAVDAGLIHKGALHSYLKRRELAQYNAADIIGVEAPGDLSYFDKELKGSCRTEVLYNWLMMREKPRSTIEWRKKLGLENKVVFFYGGNIGKAQDIDNILRLAAGLQERHDIFFLLVGSGSEEQRIRGQIEKQGLKNIRLLPALPQNEYMQCLSEFDVGMVSLDRRLKSHNFTGKVLGYVQCGKPILASLNLGNDLMEFVRRADAGIALTNGNDKELRDAALLLANHPVIRERMGKNAHALGDSVFSVRAIAQQILSHFESRKEQTKSVGSRVS